MIFVKRLCTRAIGNVECASMDQEQVRKKLECYRDLGVKQIYRREMPEPEAAQQAAVALPSLAPENESLARIREDIGYCGRCGLSKQRKNIVFGVGNDSAKLVFVGEGPGADVDEHGIPFVG